MCALLCSKYFYLYVRNFKVTPNESFFRFYIRLLFTSIVRLLWVSYSIISEIANAGDGKTAALAKQTDLKLLHTKNESVCVCVKKIIGLKAL